MSQPRKSSNSSSEGETRDRKPLSLQSSSPAISKANSSGYLSGHDSDASSTHSGSSNYPVNSILNENNENFTQFNSRKYRPSSNDKKASDNVGPERFVFEAPCHCVSKWPPTVLTEPPAFDGPIPLSKPLPNKCVKKLIYVPYEVAKILRKEKEDSSKTRRRVSHNRRQ